MNKQTRSGKQENNKQTLRQMRASIRYHQKPPSFPFVMTLLDPPSPRDSCSHVCQRKAKLRPVLVLVLVLVLLLRLVHQQHAYPSRCSRQRFPSQVRCYGSYVVDCHL